MLGATSAMVLASAMFVGCEEDGIYKVNAPSDLQTKIDAIAAELAAKENAAKKESAEESYRIGETDYSSAYWSGFSKYYQVAKNDTLEITFVNSNGGSSANYNNWVMGISNDVNIGGEGYVEYFVPRADRWDNLNTDKTVYDGSVTGLGDDDAWKQWRKDMDGAVVTVKVIRDNDGKMFLYTTAVSSDGKVTHTMNTTSNAEVGADIPNQDVIRVFFSVDHCYLNFTYSNKEGGLDPKSVIITGDVAPVEMTITGYPTTVEIGNTNFWGKAVATVKYENGQSAAVDSAKLSFTVVPDMSELGKKVVVVTYNQTMQGVFCAPVSAYYTLEVVNPIVSISAAYNGSALLYAEGCAALAPNNADFTVEATYSDGTTTTLQNDKFSVSSAQAKEGKQKVTVSYVGLSSTLTSEVEIDVKPINGSGIMVGLEDCSTPWWAHFTPDWKVAGGSEASVTFTCNSNGLNNWHSPCVVLRDSSKATEYVVVRMDSFGWGSGWEACEKTSDWNWDIFASSIDKSRITITVKNDGNGKALIRYDVVYSNGEAHFEQYADIAVNSDDLNFALVCEGSNLLFD